MDQMEVTGANKARFLLSCVEVTFSLFHLYRSAKTYQLGIYVTSKTYLVKIFKRGA